MRPHYTLKPNLIRFFILSNKCRKQYGEFLLNSLTNKTEGFYNKYKKAKEGSTTNNG